MSPARTKKFTPRPAQVLTRPRKPRLPSVAERVLPNGLRVVAVRRASVPLVQVRVRIPNAGPARGRPGPRHADGSHDDAGHVGALAGQLAEALQRIGGSIRVDEGADGSSCPARRCAPASGELLGLLAEVLSSTPPIPRAAVEREAGRFGDQLGGRSPNRG